MKKSFFVFISLVLCISMAFSETAKDSDDSSKKSVSTSSDSSANLIQIRGGMIESLYGNDFNASFQNDSIRSVMELFSRANGLNIVITPTVADVKVTASFHNASRKDAFLAILAVNNLYYLEQGNIVKILGADDYKKELTRKYLLTKTYDASIIDLDNLASILKPQLSAVGSLTIDKQSAKIIITDVADNFEKLERILIEISSLIKSVDLDIRIVQVELKNEDNFGVSWNGLNLGNVVNLNFNFPYEDDATTEKVKMSYSDVLEPSRISVDAIITALSTKYDVKLVSQPRIIALNRDTANIKIVTRVPYIKKSTRSGSGSSLETSAELGTEEVGIKLTIIPMITPKNEVRLQIEAVNSSYKLVTITGTQKAPETISTELSCDVIAANGQTVILGGLIRTEKTSDVKGVPILGHIPVLRYLFSHSSEQINRSELIFFLTPHIIEGTGGNFGINTPSKTVMDEIGMTNTAPKK